MYTEIFEFTVTITTDYRHRFELYIENFNLTVESLDYLTTQKYRLQTTDYRLLDYLTTQNSDYGFRPIPSCEVLE